MYLHTKALFTEVPLCILCILKERKREGEVGLVDFLKTFIVSIVSFKMLRCDSLANRVAKMFALLFLFGGA